MDLKDGCLPMVLISKPEKKINEIMLNNPNSTYIFHENSITYALSRRHILDFYDNATEYGWVKVFEGDSVSLYRLKDQSNDFKFRN